MSDVVPLLRLVQVSVDGTTVDVADREIYVLAGDTVDVRDVIRRTQIVRTPGLVGVIELVFDPPPSMVGWADE